MLEYISAATSQRKDRYCGAAGAFVKVAGVVKMTLVLVVGAAVVVVVDEVVVVDVAVDVVLVVLLVVVDPATTLQFTPAGQVSP